MDIAQAAGYAAGITYAIAASWYVYDIAKKRVRVSIAAQIVFMLINASQLIALIQVGSWGAVPFTVVGFFVTVTICVLSLRNRKIYLGLMDKVGFVGALVGFVIWQLTDDPALNVYILSITTLLVFVPVIVKTFKNPTYETAVPWRINLLATVFLLLTIDSTAAVVWIVPVREFISSAFMNIGIGGGSK